MAATVPVSLMVRCSGLGVPASGVRPYSFAKAVDELDSVGDRRRVPGAILGAGEALFAEAVGGLERLLAADDDGDGDAGGRGRGLRFTGCGSERCFFAAGQYNATLHGEAGSGFLWAMGEVSPDIA